MLYTNLKHIESATEYSQVINENENVVVICGRMGSTCIPVYRIAEELEKEYDRVKFFDMEFDNPESQIIRGLPEVVEVMEIPFVIYFRNGKVVKTTSGTQTRFQVTTVLDQEFSLLINA